MQSLVEDYRRGHRDDRTAFEVNGDSFIPAMNGDAIHNRSTRERRLRNQATRQNAYENRQRRVTEHARAQAALNDEYAGSDEIPQVPFYEPQYPRDPNGRIILYW